MIRMGLAFRVRSRSIRGKPVVLDPYSPEYLGSWVRGLIDKYGVVVYDTSWKKLRPEMIRGVRGIHYKLPPLLPGNPINYARPCILSSIEAVAATLYITGYHGLYEKLLGLYKWMKTFHTLNQQLLRDYREAETPEKLLETIRDYWGEKPPC
jgi:pre-rRNA-processing protein TSR3